MVPYPKCPSLADSTDRLLSLLLAPGFCRRSLGSSAHSHVNLVPHVASVSLTSSPPPGSKSLSPSVSVTHQTSLRTECPLECLEAAVTLSSHFKSRSCSFWLCFSPPFTTYLFSLCLLSIYCHRCWENEVKEHITPMPPRTYTLDCVYHRQEFAHLPSLESDLHAFCRIVNKYTWATS